MYDLREDLFERDEEDDSHLDSTRPLSSRRAAEAASNKIPHPSYTMEKLRLSFDDEDEDIFFPSYETDRKANKDNFIQLPKPSGGIKPLIQCSLSQPSFNVLKVSERPEDDTAIHPQPSRHVDYLSHEWSEEEIWSSYSFIVSKRKIISNSERLENASWRSWEKRRRNLKTVSCETVKWLKDHDVTWLYGPLQSSLQHEDKYSNATAGSQYYPGPIKPILKKLSLSQQMLQSSLSSASLRRESAGQGKTQHLRRNSISLNNSFTSLLKADLSQSRNFDSSSNSRSSSPNQVLWSSKSVRFHEVVRQCIAVPNSGEYETSEPRISEPDEEVVMMRRPAKPDLRKALREEKKALELPLPQTISELPDASLKCPGPENDAKEVGVGLGIWQGPSWCDDFAQEVEEDDSDDEEEQWEPPTWLHNRKDSVQLFHDKVKSIRMQSNAKDAKRSLLQSATLVRKDEAKGEEDHVAKSPVITDHGHGVVLNLPPCRSQLDSFYFPSKTQLRLDSPWEERIEFSPRSQDYFAAAQRKNNDMEEFVERSLDTSPTLSLPKIAMVNRIMDEFWVVFNDMERGPSVDAYHRDALLPDAVRKHLETLVRDWHDPDEKEIVEDLLSIIYTCREQFTPHRSSQSSDLDQDQDQDHQLTESPRMSSDSGYGSEEIDRVRVVIKDINTALLEKEKGVQDWALYSDAWDEDEAVAWERGY